MLKSKN